MRSLLMLAAVLSLVLFLAPAQAEEGSSATLPRPVLLTFTPSEESRASAVSTSVMAGRFESSTGSENKRQENRIGRAAFFEP